MQSHSNICYKLDFKPSIRTVRKGSQFGWWGVRLVQVVFSSFWVVSDGFCRLRIILDGSRCLAVLLVTPIPQHTEELTLYYTLGRTWLTEVIRFFYSK